MRNQNEENAWCVSQILRLVHYAHYFKRVIIRDGLVPYFAAADIDADAGVDADADAAVTPSSNTLDGHFFM